MRGGGVSLDVYLKSKREPRKCEECKTCPWCDGTGFDSGYDRLFEANATHNLNRMAEEAGIYHELWRPDEIAIGKAWQLVDPLTKGLELLRSDPERFKKFNPPNGWGSYDGFCRFIASYLSACRDYPDSDVEVSR